MTLPPTPVNASSTALIGAENEAMLQSLLSNPKLTPATLARYLDPKWIPAPHLMYLSLRVAAALNKGDARIIISLPPRHGKTRISSIGTTVWALERWPQKQIVLTSYGADLSEEFSGNIRDQITNNSDKLTVRIKKDSNRIDKFKTTKGGGVLAIGTGGPFTGRGADILFVDDFVKDYKEAQSATTREFVWNWFTSTAFTRLEPHGSVVIVATRWHEDDLIGRLLTRFPGAWEYIRIPAIAEENDVLGRAAGVPLFPERYPLSYLLQWKALLGTKMFDALYQQDPRSDETRLANKEWILRATILPNANLLSWARVWDLAATQGGGDYTTGGLHCMDSSTRFMYTAQMFRKQLSPKNVEAAVRATAIMDGPSVPIYIEQEPGSSGVALIEHYQRNVLPEFTVRGVTATKAKVVRAQPYLAGAEFGRHYILQGDWNEEFLKEFDTFPTGEHDDQVDNCAIAWQELVGKETVSVTWGRNSPSQPTTKEGSADSDLEDSVPRSSSRTSTSNRNRKTTIIGQSNSLHNIPVTGATWGRARPGQPVARPKGSGLIFSS